MKTDLLYTLLFLSLAGSTDALAAPASALATRNSKARLDWQPGSRDERSTEWLATEQVTNTATGTVTSRQHRYVSLGSCINYLDENRQWKSSQDLIEITAEGASSIHGPNKMHFSPNLNNGPITIVTSNRVLQTRVLGLYYFDSASGKSVRLSSVQDSLGELLPPNQIVYRSALAYGDIRITCAKEGFEMDLILTKRPKPPEAYSLDSATTRLELWHEYIGAGTPRLIPRVIKSENGPARASMAEPDLIDETINIDNLWFPPMGRAFSVGGAADPQADTTTNAPARIRISPPGNDPNESKIFKRWLVIDGKDVLVETIPWLSLKPQLDSLPELAGEAGSKQTVFAQRRLPESEESKPRRIERIRVASASYKPKGLLWDYTTVSGGGDFEFASDTTYFIDSNIYTGGTVTYDANCHIKFANGGISILYGTIVCNGTTSSYSTFTSKNDDSFGETISGSTGTPACDYGAAINIYYEGSDLTLSGLKIRWAQRGLQLDIYSGTTDTVADSAFEFCQQGIYAGGGNITIDNCTQCGVQTPTYTPDPYSTYFSGSLTDICGPDGDYNGIADAWEYQYFNHVGVDPAADPDGDHLTNLIESVLNTDPLHAAVPDTGGTLSLQVYTPLK